MLRPIVAGARAIGYILRGCDQALTPTSSMENPMQTVTWVTMIVIMTFVWGGFAFLLATALRKESGKSAE